MNEVSLSSAVWKTFLPPYISRNWLLLLSTFCFIVTAPRGIALMGGERGGLGFEPPIPLSFSKPQKRERHLLCFAYQTPLLLLEKGMQHTPPLPSRFTPTTPTVW